MKKLFPFYVLFCGILNPSYSFANCESTLDLEFFQAEIQDVSGMRGFKKVSQAVEEYGVIVSTSPTASYHTTIKTGIEANTSEGKSTLYSQIIVTKKNGSVAFEHYRTKVVSAEKTISKERILKFAKNHILKEYPSCGKRFTQSFIH